MPEPIRFTAPVTIEAAAGKGPRRFTATAYTGGPLVLRGFGLPIVIDLAGLTTRNKVAANLDHDEKRRVGHVDQTSNDGSKLILSGIVSAVNDAAAEFTASYDAGYPWQASIEAYPGKLEEIPAGETVHVNGQSPQGPMYIARQTVLSGVAFVSNGADDNTTVAIAANQKRGKRMSFQNFLHDVHAQPELLSESQLAMVHANYHGREVPTDEDRAAVAPMIAASAADPVAAEDKRLKQIEAATRPPRESWDDRADKVRELKAQAVRGDIDVDELLTSLRPIRAELHDRQIPESYGPTRPRSHGENEKVITAALCLSAGIAKPEEHFTEPMLDAADRMRGVGIQSCLLQAAAANGYHVTPGVGISQGNLRSVLQHAFPPIQAGGFSTVSLPNVFSNTANKFLHEGFNSIDQTALRISGRRSVSDFKTATTVSLLGNSQFSQLPPDGEIEHGTLDELTYTNKADTYAKMYAITRQDIINDDLDALSQIPRRLGRGAMLQLNHLVWTAFLDNASFFTTGTGSARTGADSALALDGLQKAEALFVNQTDPDGFPLGLMPAILLVPPALKATALELVNSSLVITGADTTRPSANIWQSRFRVESSPYMENSSYTGFSAAAWYLLADPMSLSTIEIASLNGRVEPVVETADADFNVLGVQMRGYSDVGVALQEFRAGVRSAGS